MTPVFSSARASFTSEESENVHLVLGPQERGSIISLVNSPAPCIRHSDYMQMRHTA